MILQGKKATVTSARAAETKTPIPTEIQTAILKRPENARLHSAIVQPAQIEKPVYQTQEPAAVQDAACQDKHYKNEKEDITLNHLFRQ